MCQDGIAKALIERVKKCGRIKHLEVLARPDAVYHSIPGYTNERTPYPVRLRTAHGVVICFSQSAVLDIIKNRVEIIRVTGVHI